MAKHGCKCEEHECECPEWIFTFADLVMLMMGFFVLMWVLKPAPGKQGDPAAAAAQTEEWLLTVGEIRAGFGWVPNPNSKDPVDKVYLRHHNNGPGEGGKTVKPRQGQEGTDPEVTTIRPAQEATVGGHVGFARGDATIPAAGIGGLDQIAAEVRGHRTIVMIKGHTSLDDFPENTGSDQKMSLSLRRAQAVAEYLVAHGVAPDMVRVQGCSTFEPVAQRAYTSESQALNRRVEVQSTDLLVSECQDRSQPATVPAVK